MTRHRARPSFTVEIKRSRTSPLPDGERPQSERPAGKPTGFSNPADALFKPQGAAKPAAAAKPPAAAKPAASAPAPSEPETRPASPGRNLWAGTGLFEEAAAATQSGRFDPPDPPIFSKAPAETPADKVFADKNFADKVFAAKDAASSKNTASPKRVLPSLIAPPEPAPEPEVAPEPEPKLPRVRRYRTAEPAPRRNAGPRPAFVWPEDWPDEAPIQTPAPITVPAAARRQDKVQDRIELPKTEAAPQGSEESEIRPRVKRRTGDEDLRIGQRWKRRLPRVCW